MSPWKCVGSTLMKWDASKGHWVKNKSQPRIRTAAACQRLKRALYANVPHSRK